MLRNFANICECSRNFLIFGKKIAKYFAFFFWKMLQNVTKFRDLFAKFLIFFAKIRNSELFRTCLDFLRHPPKCCKKKERKIAKYVWICLWDLTKFREISWNLFFAIFCKISRNCAKYREMSPGCNFGFSRNFA